MIPTAGSGSGKSELQWSVNIRWPKNLGTERDSEILYFIEAQNENCKDGWVIKPKLSKVEEDSSEYQPPDSKSCGIFTVSNIISDVKVPGSATRARISLRRKRAGATNATESYNSKEGKLEIKFTEVGMIASITSYYQENKKTIARYLRLGATAMSLVGFQGSIVAMVLNLVADTLEGEITNTSLKNVLNKAIDSMPEKYQTLKDASKNIISAIKVDNGQVSDWGSLERYKDLARLLLNDDQSRTINLLQSSFTNIHDMLRKLVLAVEEKDKEQCDNYMAECREFAKKANASLGEVHVGPVASSIVPILSIFVNEETRVKLENATGTIEDCISKSKAFFTCFVSIIDSLELYELRAALSVIRLDEIKDTLVSIVNLVRTITSTDATATTTDTRHLSESIASHIKNTRTLVERFKILCTGITAEREPKRLLPGRFVDFFASLSTHCDTWLNIVKDNNLEENVSYFISLLDKFQVVKITRLCSRITQELLVLKPQLQNTFSYIASSQQNEITLDGFSQHLETISGTLSNLLNYIFGPQEDNGVVSLMVIVNTIITGITSDRDDHRILRNILKSALKVDDDALDSKISSLLTAFKSARAGIESELRRSSQGTNPSSRDTVLFYIRSKLLPLFYLRSRFGDIREEFLSLQNGLLAIQRDITRRRIDDAIVSIRNFCRRPFHPRTIGESTIVQLILLREEGGRYVLEPIRELIAKSILSPKEYNEEGKRDETLDEKLNSYIEGTENKLLATMNTVSLVSSQDARKEKAAMIGKFIFGVITLTGSISLFSAILSRLVRGDYIENIGFGGSKVMIPLALPFGSVFGIAALTASFIYRSVLDVTDNLYPDTSVVSFSIKNAALLFLTGFFVGIAFEYGPSWMEILGITTLIVSGTALTITNAIGLKKSLTITREAVAPNP